MAAWSEPRNRRSGAQPPPRPDYRGWRKSLVGSRSPCADPASVAAAVIDIVNKPFGTRPFRIHIDPSQDGAELVNGVADRVRAEMFRNIGLADLLKPVDNARAEIAAGNRADETERKRKQTRAPKLIFSG
jgi:hypothetical protein